MRYALPILALALALVGCARLQNAIPVDVGVTLSPIDRPPQWGVKICVPTASEVNMAQDRPKVYFFGLARGQDWWGAPLEKVYPPVPGVA